MNSKELAMCCEEQLSYDLKLQTITPQIASLWIKEQPNWKLRPIRKSSVARYKSDILKGRWDSSTAIAVHIDHKGKVFLANGQHRLAAIALSGKAVPMGVMYFHSLESAKRFREICDFNTPITSADLVVALTNIDDPAARTACVNIMLLAYYRGAITKLIRPSTEHMKRHIEHMRGDYDIVRSLYGVRNKTIAAALMLGVGMLQRKQIDLDVYRQMKTNTIHSKSWGILNRYIERSRDTISRVRFGCVLDGITQIARTGKLTIKNSLDSKDVLCEAVNMGARFLLPKP